MDPCAYFQKLVVWINYFFSDLGLGTISWFGSVLFMIKLNNKFKNLSGSTVWKGVLFVHASTIYDKAVIPNTT